MNHAAAKQKLFSLSSLLFFLLSCIGEEGGERRYIHTCLHAPCTLRSLRCPNSGRNLPLSARLTCKEVSHKLELYQQHSNYGNIHNTYITIHNINIYYTFRKDNIHIRLHLNMHCNHVKSPLSFFPFLSIDDLASST